MTRSPCWPGAAGAGRSCSPRCARFRAAAGRPRGRPGRRPRPGPGRGPPWTCRPRRWPSAWTAFWSPGLSPARLRALAAAPGSAAPDLLLRMFPPPPVQVRGKDLADVLTPAYQRLGRGRPGAGVPGEPASRASAGRGPDAAHGLGQAPPAQRGQPLVVVDRAQDLPQRGDRQEQVLHAELVELVVVVGSRSPSSKSGSSSSGLLRRRSSPSGPGIVIPYVGGEVGGRRGRAGAADGERGDDRQPVEMVDGADGGDARCPSPGLAVALARAAPVICSPRGRHARGQAEPQLAVVGGQVCPAAARRTRSAAHLASRA